MEMDKIILVLDSFKGNLSSLEACTLVKEGFILSGVKNEIKVLPVADGGEGTVDAFLAAVGGEKIFVKARDPFLRAIDSFFGILPDGSAVIEVAAACGLPLVDNERDIRRASSAGVGDIITAALNRGCKKIIIGLGGSATNDGGIGMASSLGVRLFDSGGEELSPDHAGLESIHSLDISNLDERLKDTQILVACDVDNPLCGERGASNVFGPQKGATKEDIAYLDNNLDLLSKAVKRSLNKDAGTMPGSGAAGGLGFALVSFLSAQLMPGIDIVLDAACFERELSGACLVITGEGRIDGQSAGGKAPVGVAKRAKKAGVPVIAMVGDIADGAQSTYDHGISAIFSIHRVALDYEKIRLRCKNDLRDTAADVGRLLRATGYLK